MTSTVLITGVSTGIGKAAAVEFLRHGWRVYGSVRKAGDAQDLAGANTNFHELVFDVTDEAARRPAIASIAAAGHELSVVVNNAGIAPSGPIEVIPEVDYRQLFEVNVFGALNVTRDCLPQLHLTREKHPNIPVRIINVTSVAGILTSPFTSLYSASKFALESITDGLRRELLTFNIDAVSVAPGPVKTEIWNKAMGREHIYTDTRYAFVVDKLDAYISNAESSGISAESVGQKIYEVATATSPSTFNLLMPKAWLMKLLRWLPSRTLDNMVWKNINKSKRY